MSNYADLKSKTLQLTDSLILYVGNLYNVTMNMTGLTSTVDYVINTASGKTLTIGSGVADETVNIATQTGRSTVLRLGNGVSNIAGSHVHINNGTNSVGNTQINTGSGQTGTITIGNATGGTTTTNLVGNTNLTGITNINGVGSTSTELITIGNATALGVTTLASPTTNITKVLTNLINHLTTATVNVFNSLAWGQNLNFGTHGSNVYVRGYLYLNTDINSGMSIGNVTNPIAIRGEVTINGLATTTSNIVIGNTTGGITNMKSNTINIATDAPTNDLKQITIGGTSGAFNSNTTMNGKTMISNLASIQLDAPQVSSAQTIGSNITTGSITIGQNLTTGSLTIGNTANTFVNNSNLITKGFKSIQQKIISGFSSRIYQKVLGPIGTSTSHIEQTCYAYVSDVATNIVTPLFSIENSSTTSSFASQKFEFTISGWLGTGPNNSATYTGMFMITQNGGNTVPYIVGSANNNNPFTYGLNTANLPETCFTFALTTRNVVLNYTGLTGAGNAYLTAKLVGLPSIGRMSYHIVPLL